MRTDIARQHMIYNQIRTWDVVDKSVLATLVSVPRERFVPDQFRELAFADVALPLPDSFDVARPAAAAALAFWQRVSQDERISAGFRAVCVLNAEALERLRRVMG